MAAEPGTDLTPGATGQAAQTIGELNWEGTTVWTFGEKAPYKVAGQHHDWARLPNGNTLVLSTLMHPIAGFKQPVPRDDVIRVVSRHAGRRDRVSRIRGPFRTTGFRQERPTRTHR